MFNNKSLINTIFTPFLFIGYPWYPRKRSVSLIFLNTARIYCIFSNLMFVIIILCINICRQLFLHGSHYSSICTIVSSFNLHKSAWSLEKIGSLVLRFCFGINILVSLTFFWRTVYVCECEFEEDCNRFFNAVASSLKHLIFLKSNPFWIS